MNKLAYVVFVVMGAVGVAQAAAPAAAPAAVVGNAKAGQTKAAVCGACHGVDGNSMVPTFPKLAGQHATYIVKQLQGFNAKPAAERTDPVMSPMAAPLTAQDMADVAAYFSSQKRVIGAPADVELAKKGQAIYQGGVAAKGVAACMSCHGPAGIGNGPANFPSLQGQQNMYVAKALRDFKSGVRVTDPNRMMRDLAAKLSDDEINAVTEYITGLH